MPSAAINSANTPLRAATPSHRQLTTARSVQRNVERHPQPDGLGDPTVIEPQYPDGADRAGESGIEHVVETVVAHAGGTEQAAVDFVSEALCR
jgi:hypothetical protein